MFVPKSGSTVNLVWEGKTWSRNENGVLSGASTQDKKREKEVILRKSRKEKSDEEKSELCPNEERKLQEKNET